MQSDPDTFLHGNLIKIRHLKTKGYLKGTIHSYVERSFLKKKEIDELYIGTTPDADDFYTNFIIEKQIPHSDELQIGDLVRIQNYCTQLFVSLDSSKKSESTQQCRATLCDQYHYFIIQPDFDIKEINELKNLIVSKNQLIRFVSADNSYCLHSHAISYRNEEVDNYNEVTGFLGHDDNDLWQLIYVDSSKVKNFFYQSQLQKPLFVVSDETVIIRNFWTGWTLHSHKQQYKSTKKQEVTAYSFPRDANDEWIVHKAFAQGEKQITKTDEILLEHKSTKGFLSCNNKKCISNLGWQPYASTEGAKNSFTFETLNGEPLKENSPFIIRFNSNHSFLTQTGSKAESKIGTQQEVAFTQNFGFKSVWIIEQRKK